MSTHNMALCVDIVCLFELIPYVPSQSISYIGTGLPGLNKY